jgi:hypothetical protein
MASSVAWILNWESFPDYSAQQQFRKLLYRYGFCRAPGAIRLACRATATLATVCRADPNLAGAKKQQRLGCFDG